MLRHLAKLYGRRLGTLVWFVTAHCNARCSHCYQDVDREPKGRELTPAEAEKISSKLGRLMLLQCSGGEPTLREDLAELLDPLVRIAAAVTVPTNAWVPERIEQVAGGLAGRHPGTALRIALSIDGVGDRHDRIRGLPGSFERVIEAHARLRELQRRYRNLLLTVNTVFGKMNEEELPAIVDFVHRLGVDHHTVTYLWGSPRDGSTAGPSVAAYRKVIERVRSLSYGRGGAGPAGAAMRALNRLADESILSLLEGGSARFPCQAIRKFVVLSPIGEVTACHLIGRSLGSVRDFDYDLPTLLKGAHARELRSEIIRTRCTCHVQCMNRNNILYNPKTPAALLARHIVPGRRC